MIRSHKQLGEMLSSHMQQRCVSLNASQKAELAVRLFTRISLSPLSVLIVDYLIARGNIGCVADLAEFLQLPPTIIVAEIDSLRNSLVVSGDSDGDAMYRIDFRKALSVTHANVGRAFVSLQATDYRSIPDRLKIGLPDTDDFRRAPFVCCAKCAMAVRVCDLANGVYCATCSSHVGFDGAVRIAEHVLRPTAPIDALPFVVPQTFERDHRLCLHALLFSALLRDTFCCLTSDQVVTSSSALLAPLEVSQLSKGASKQTLRYA